MITSLLGATITRGMLYVAGAVVAVLLSVAALEGVAIWWLKGDLAAERERYAELQAKNARCETESAGLKASLTTQNKAVDEIKASCAVADAASRAALELARKQRPMTAAEVANILGAKPQYPEDLCRSACAEMRKELRK